jgi:retron-type reverse transcriptase
MGIKKILEAIYEVDFRDISHGFRPKRSHHDALEIVDKAIMTNPVNYIVDMDIEKFFDSVDHRWMMECLKQRISDPNFLRLIARFLKSGIMEEGNYMETDKGTPQGGIVSPVLSNIYLHYVLDLWYEKQVKKETRGYTQMIRTPTTSLCFEHKEEAKRSGTNLESVSPSSDFAYPKQKVEPSPLVGRHGDRQRNKGASPRPSTFSDLPTTAPRRGKGSFGQAGRPAGRSSLKSSRP